ncbi:MAG: alpha/beta fold hydrolase [Acidimicrobiia bacterium]|nr:alpha/beta fold hydrolase [Acidimicrobiia bacterium]
MTATHRSDLVPLLHPDPLVRQVLETWTPRFLSAGIPIGELARTVERVTTWDDWAKEWLATGELHDERGDHLATEGHVESATNAWQLACACYHVGYHVAIRDHALHEHGLSKMLEIHDKALPHMRPAVSKFELGSGVDRIVGLLSTPPTDDPAPVVVLLPGLDSTKETRHAARGGWVARGLAVISIDGPGQGEASRWSNIRPDYNVAVSALIDWIEQQDALDHTRIAVVGVSLGGYYAPLAAAHEPRISATVGNCGPYDWAACWDLIPQVTREAFIHYSGASSDDEAFEIAKLMTLEGVAEKIETPLMIVHGENDPLVPWEHGKRIVDEASGPSELVLIEGGNHGVNNLSFASFPVMRDWICDQLGVNEK